MKLQVTQENLNRALAAVARVANSRGTLPILANVLLKTYNNRLSVSATNLDIAITHFIGAKVSEEGSITIPARLMQDYVASLPNGVINLDLNESKLKIKADKYNSVINGIVADDFPVMPAISDGTKWSIPSNIFKKALQQVAFAASSDESRPVLTAIFIHSSKDSLYIASTDSYRLAEKNLGSNNNQVSILIPASAMNDLLRVLGDDDSQIEVTHNDQQALFKTGDIELVTRLIDGQYPDYQKLIPSAFTNQATLKKSDLVNVAKVSSLFARESAGSVTIELNKDSNQLEIKSIASQLGENTATADAKIKGGDSITLNSKFLIDALGVIEGETVTFGFNGKLEPTILYSPDNKDYKHIIMPLKS